MKKLQNNSLQASFDHDWPRAEGGGVGLDALAPRAAHRGWCLREDRGSWWGEGEKRKKGREP